MPENLRGVPVFTTDVQRRWLDPQPPPTFSRLLSETPVMLELRKIFRLVAPAGRLRTAAIESIVSGPRVPVLSRRRACSEGCARQSFSPESPESQREPTPFGEPLLDDGEVAFPPLNADATHTATSPPVYSSGEPEISRPSTRYAFPNPFVDDIQTPFEHSQAEDYTLRNNGSSGTAQSSFVSFGNENVSTIQLGFPQRPAFVPPPYRRESPPPPYTSTSYETPHDLPELPQRPHTAPLQLSFAHNSISSPGQEAGHDTNSAENDVACTTVALSHDADSDYADAQSNFEAESASEEDAWSPGNSPPQIWSGFTTAGPSALASASSSQVQTPLSAPELFPDTHADWSASQETIKPVTPPLPSIGALAFERGDGGAERRDSELSELALLTFDE
ncbi:MAG: hypothetical protein Q9162_004098 [Coniocarpon cinnabarinum]